VVHSDPSEAPVGAALLDDVVLPGAESVPRQSAVRDVVDLTQLPVEGQEDAPAPSREDAQEDDISNAVTKGIRELEDVPFSKWTVNIDPLRHSIHKKRCPKRKITVKASSSTMDYIYVPTVSPVLPDLQEVELDHLGPLDDESINALPQVSDEAAVQDDFANDSVSREGVLSSDASPHELADTSVSLEEVMLPISPSALVRRRSQRLKRRKAALEESIQQESLALDRAVQEAAHADGETPEAKRIRVNLMMNSDDLLEELQLRDRKHRLRKSFSRAQSCEPVVIQAQNEQKRKTLLLIRR
jgi:hypothetical protein